MMWNAGQNYALKDFLKFSNTALLFVSLDTIYERLLDYVNNSSVLQTFLVKTDSF